MRESEIEGAEQSSVNENRGEESAASPATWRTMVHGEDMMAAEAYVGARMQAMGEGGRERCGDHRSLRFDR